MVFEDWFSCLGECVLLQVLERRGCVFTETDAGLVFGLLCRISDVHWLAGCLGLALLLITSVLGVSSGSSNLDFDPSKQFLVFKNRYTRTNFSTVNLIVT